VVAWPGRMISGTHHGEEAGVCDGWERPGVLFSPIEEAVADALAAVGGQEDGFTEVEYCRGIIAGAGEGMADIVRLAPEGACGGGTDQGRRVKGGDYHRTGRTGERGEIVFFIAEITIVEIGIFCEHGDAQAGECGDLGGEVGACEWGDVDAHGRGEIGAGGWRDRVGGSAPDLIQPSFEIVVGGDARDQAIVEGEKAPGGDLISLSCGDGEVMICGEVGAMDDKLCGGPAAIV